MTPRRDWQMYAVILGPWIALGVLEAIWPAIR